MNLRTTHSSIKRIIWMERTTCHACKKEADFYLYRREGTVGIVYIPIAKKLQEGYIVCNLCNASKKISGQDAKDIYRKQLKHLKNGGFPKEIVQADCNLSDINITKRVKRLVYSTIWTLLYTRFFINNINDILREYDGPFYNVVLLYVLLLIPLILSIINLIPAVKKSKAYKSARSLYDLD